LCPAKKTSSRRLIISDHDDRLVSLVPAWIEATTDTEIPAGLAVDEALKRALDLRERLRSGTVKSLELRVDAELVETLHALCSLFDQSEKTGSRTLLVDCSSTFDFVSAIEWPEGHFGGKEDVLSRLAFLCWRYARQAGDVSSEAKWLEVHSSIDISHALGNIEAILATPINERSGLADQVHLEDADQLLSLCELLRRVGDIDPAKMRDEAEFFYRILERPSSGRLTSTERDFFLGELCLLAGGGCRLLSRWDEANRWFDLSDVNFASTDNPRACIARVAYQRLALKVEKRELDHVLDFAPRWTACFNRLGLREEALKCRFLEAHALKETGRLPEAKLMFKQIKEDAHAEHRERLAAIASENLVQLHAFLGEVEAGITEARQASALLVKLNNRVGLAKLQFGLGNLLRAQGRFQEAIHAFQEAQRQCSELQMYRDVAETYLVLADLLLDAGQPAQAELEIRAALPIIEELKLVPESIAALSILRDSLRRRQIDRQALRNLNGYFEELGS
jgi:tetratricopeptide (TPR) repeat protein